MRSVAGELREEQEREVLALTPGARVELALRLAEDGLRFFMETNRLDREAAIVLIRKQRSAGRVPSRCMDDLP